jgi:holin-like protein
MLGPFAVLLIFQLCGELLSFLLRLPVPGPVLGMLLLFAALLAFPRLQDYLDDVSGALLRHLSLLFVPAGTGILVAGGSGGGHWFAIALAVLGSTVLTLGVTAVVLQLGARDSDEGGDA